MLGSIRTIVKESGVGQLKAEIFQNTDGVYSVSYSTPVREFTKLYEGKNYYQVAQIAENWIRDVQLLNESAVR